jgi:hypothetical protein
MKKLRLLGFVGITSIALGQVSWAGHAGGIGGGGGFGGGFGGGHAVGGAPHFSGGPARFVSPGYSARVGMSPIRPHVFSGPERATINRSAVSNIARNRAVIPSATRPSRTLARAGSNGPRNRPNSSNIAKNHAAMSSAARASRTSVQPGLNGRTDHISERHDGNWHRDWDRRHAHFNNGRFFVFDDGFWFGLDAGFFPWDYLPYYADDYYPYDYYAAVEPYDNTPSAYPATPTPDPTVEVVQTRLAQLGYYNGPADGIFGPTTRDAVAKYQIAQHLDVTGSLSPDTMQSLDLAQAAAN